MTDFRTSTTTREIDTPQLRASQLVARPGTLPTIVIPMIASSTPDVQGIWRHLHEPAEFFGIPMPTLDDLSAAISAVAATFADGVRPALIAVTVTIAETDGAPRTLVTGSTVQPIRNEPVRIDGGLPTPPMRGVNDPWWRRMAARTTSQGEADQCERWLNARGFADAVTDGQPILGALVFESDAELVGVENAEPTSILDQMAHCGAIATIDRAPECPTDADRVWWLSPRYETHPVTEIHGRRFAVNSDAVPPYARWS